MENEERKREGVSEEEEKGREPDVLFNLVYAGNNPAPNKKGCVGIVARKDGKEARVFYDYGDDVMEMIDLFGEEVVFSNARGKMVIGLQAAMRARLKSDQSIEDLMAKYKPGVALEKIPTDMNKATEDYFAGLSDDEQDAMIARLMSRKDI
ncbi:hypothetical protein KAX02_13525 [candidate division WOR-3 bacterium]|nr:hypothetical protein [candidate division WOR-3 bacterium]